MKKTIEQLEEKFPGAVLETSKFRGETAIVIKKEKILNVLSCLKNEFDFSMLLDICAVDYPEKDPRFEVVYHLYSFKNKERLRLKVRVREHNASVPTATGIWRAANWFEREAFDLFGIFFEEHPNLKRLLTYDGFEGHALRKDYEKNRRQFIPKPDPLIRG